MDIIEEAFRMHRQQLVNYVNKRVDDYDLAEDIVQDAFVRLLGMEVGVREESIKPLLFTTCQHLIFDYLRRKKVAETVYQYMYTCESHAVETSEAILYAQELSTEEERVVSAMPWKRQQVYRLSRFEGQSIGEIAASMGVAHKTVEVHLFVGRKEVREQLRAYAS
ncbi:MAG: sigma-70 family RNA polymerase sigma factor [Bacteroidaceae bacterium]|nr:sigma-70 family RNA polymerase sigma factor [Bacteroidaceae bacterium]